MVMRCVGLSDDVETLWVKAKESESVATSPQRPGDDRKQYDVEKVQRQRQEMKECLRVLREREIGPYFDGDVYKCFTAKQVRTSRRRLKGGRRGKRRRVRQ